MMYMVICLRFLFWGSDLLGVHRLHNKEGDHLLGIVAMM